MHPQAIIVFFRVPRRTGGLEMPYPRGRLTFAVPRRTGGLEKYDFTGEIQLSVPRRTGGLETAISLCRQCL